MKAFVVRQTLFLYFIKNHSLNLYIFVTFIVENTEVRFSTNDPKINQRNSKLIDEP